MGGNPHICSYHGVVHFAIVGSAPPLRGAFMEVVMRVLRRKGVSKSGSARKFKRMSKRTKGANIKSPMRGGIRL
jgi:hypothetical protein